MNRVIGKSTRSTSGSYCLSLALAFLCPVLSWALPPGKYVTQYSHSAWRVQDGFFTGSPMAVVQTQDGYVWVGTKSGLLRFDGVRFVPWNPEHGEHLPSNEITRLLVARDGSFWIGTRAGLSRWKNGELTNYTSAPGGILSLLEDREGNIWFQKLEANERAGPLCEVVGEMVRCHGVNDGVPFARGGDALAEDQQGTLWVGGETALLHWKNGLTSILTPRGLNRNAGMEGITGLAFAPGGTLFVGMGVRGPGLGLQRLIEGRWGPVKTSDLDGSDLVVSALYPDREGALWIGTRDRGIYRLYRNEFEHFDGTKGLSSDDVWSFSEDREGNLWVATSEGVDRFSDTKVTSFSSSEGLCSGEIDSVLASRDGSLWVGGAGALSILRNGKVSCLRTGQGLPGSQVTSILEDHAGRMWIGIDDTLSVYEKGRFREVKRQNRKPIGLVRGITEDAENSIWVTVMGPPATLIRIEGLTVKELHPEPDLPGARRIAADPAGGIWMGLLNGDLAHYRAGTPKRYQFPHDSAAQVHQLLVTDDGSVLAATTYGLVGLQTGKSSILAAQNGLPCEAVNAMTFDSQGNLWLFMDCALGKLERAGLQAWWLDPQVKVPIQTFDALDGVRTGQAPFDAATRSPDGHLWFVNGQFLETIDPAQSAQTLAPLVRIEQIVADRKNYSIVGLVHLPSLTRDLEIDYAGLSFAAPQKVSFRYRLEGHDRSWQEPGTRRQAFYSNLHPGTYHFRVIARNGDGVWNEEGATLDFNISPAWFQTIWFRMLSLVAATAMLWAIYRFRVRRIASAMSSRFDERLEERTRMARDLHDTFLQTIQGSRMVVDLALKNSDDPNRMRQALEQLSDWLVRATQEGRSALHSLRESTSETNDLAGAFRRALEDCRRETAIETSFSITGDAREMHPVVRDEVYRIGYEAIRNACSHSSGSRIDVALNYGNDLTLQVGDDGIGIDPVIAETGRDGHFGLQGIRERAERIGAKLTVSSSPNSGSEIKVIIPGQIIFRKPRATQLDKIRKILKNTENN